MNKLLLACAGLLVLANVVVLSGVIYNRADEPLNSLNLTERELPVQSVNVSNNENSGMHLKLRWLVLQGPDEPRRFYSGYGNPGWLDERKLVELGLDVDKLKQTRQKYPAFSPPKTVEVILVLEYQGEAYRQDVARTERALKKLQQQEKSMPDLDIGKKIQSYTKQLQRMKLSQSRLYVIDAGQHVVSLQQKYPDRHKYLFARGEISAGWKKDHLYGHVRRLYIPQVHVPLPDSQQLVDITKGKKYYSYGAKPIAPRYRVKLNIGLRLEPWIETIAAQSN